MLSKLSVFALFLLVHLSESKLPSFLKTCARSDPNFNKCAKENAGIALPSLLKGDRKFKLPSLTPLEVTILRIEPGPNFKINFTNVKLEGLQKVEIQDVNFNFKDKKVMIKLFAPGMRMLSDYEIGGRILLLPISGKGPQEMSWGNIVFTYTLDYDLYKKNGVEYMRPKNGKIVYELDSLHFKFDNLFNGDKVLGATTNQFLNENWKEVNKELGTGIAEALAQVFNAIVKGIVETTPFNEIFPEKL